MLRIVAFVLATMPAVTAIGAFPTDDEWRSVNQSGVPLWDVIGDGGSGGRDVVGDIGYPSAYFGADSSHVYLRLRLDVSPEQYPGNLRPYGWGFLVDTDGDLASYEVALEACCISDEVMVLTNTNPSPLSDPNDEAETLVASQGWQPGVNGRIILAETVFAGTPDYYLDWAVPRSALLAAGIGEGAPVRLWAGTSSLCSNMGTDLVGHVGSPTQGDLHIAVSDEITLMPAIAAAGGFRAPGLVLAPAGPNPTSGDIAFRVGLAESGPVLVELLDLRGRRLQGYTVEEPSGWSLHRFRGRDGFGRPLPSGTYFYRVRAAGEIRMGRVLLLR